ncbi:MAG: YifB family Mg chelatase-like AAA ATPase [Oligoflexales bacterium]
MNTKVKSAICDALRVKIVEVEAAMTRGFAGMQLIGNASPVCNDGRERVKSALETAGVRLPNQKLVVSLAPGDEKKEGSHWDLAIAVSVALACVQDKAPVVAWDQWLFAAELGLHGDLKAVRNVVPLAISVLGHRLRGIVIAEKNLAEINALLACEYDSLRGLKVIAFETLRQVLDWIYHDRWPPRPHLRGATFGEPAANVKQFDDMILTPHQELAALCCAAGGHNVLTVGPPGTGKSMFAERLVSIIPRMEKDLHLEALQIHSAFTHNVSKLLLAGVPPFRSPHHSSSSVALIGGGQEPGEVSLAHGGVLFLDEFTEFRRDFLESLRVPLETGEVAVSRLKNKAKWRCKVILIAACNPCPCGWSGSSRRMCNCPTQRVLAYQSKISGPVMDRIDIKLAFNEVTELVSNFFETLKTSKGNKTATMLQKVMAARDLAQKRNAKFSVNFNRDIPVAHLQESSGLSEAAFSDLIKQFDKESISQRAMVRSLRVARTLADLENRTAVSDEDLSTAIGWQRRVFGSELWPGK